MSFFAVLLALLLEQLQATAARQRRPRRADRLDRAGTGAQLRRRQATSHAWVVWCITVLVPTRRCAARLRRRWRTSTRCSASRFDVAVLYLTLGFRQFSHYFTDIRAALERGDEIEARRLLAEWRHLDASELPRVGIPAPRDRAFAARRAPPRVRRLLLVRAAVDASASARPARCCTGWPSSSAATGRTAAAAPASPSTSG